MIKLIKFNLDCYRMGELHGLFFATEEEVMEKVIGRRVYFGEVLGKHSEVEAELGEEHFTVITLPDDVIQTLEDAGIATGINPLHYVEDT